MVPHETRVAEQQFFPQPWCIILVKLSKNNPRVKRAFETLYKKWALPLTKFIVKRMGGDTEAAEEVFSRTITAAWKGFTTFRHKSSFFTWLCRIALNKIADYYRDQVNYNSRFITPTIKKLSQYKSKDINLEEKLALEELKEAVHDCLNLLPYEKRRLLWLRYWQELTLAEIAKTLGISERAVEGRLYRARQSLATIIQTNQPSLVDT